MHVSLIFNATTDQLRSQVDRWRCHPFSATVFRLTYENNCPCCLLECMTNLTLTRIMSMCRLGRLLARFLKREHNSPAGASGTSDLLISQSTFASCLRNHLTNVCLFFVDLHVLFCFTHLVEEESFTYTGMFIRCFPQHFIL